jgi:stage V sporulation protein AE
MEILINCIKAFLVGGGICLIGQVLIDFTKLTPARILVSFIVAGVILSALGLYGPIAEFAGAGATVPLVGFGHLLAEGVKEAVDEFGLIGVLTGGLSAAATGIGTAITAGFIASLLFRPGDRTTK